ncbi:MAG: type IX secretion system plug protein domain-containing protein, partial [Bacteroidota bacterium]
MVYEKHVKTVLFYPSQDAESDQRFFNPAVIPLSATNSLILEYDILGQEMPECRAKIIHCTYDWKPSNINTIEYLNAFNDILVQFRQ